ncbi:MAG TPA: YihY/virulence factor BrkB family protein [Bacteroidales bacterium]|nr:YihY/virulence factor BrkB family protein [Bacteroidales bacterium]
MITFLKSARKVIVRAGRKFRKDDPVRLAGTTAYFAIFAMAPIVIIIISLVGLIMGKQEISSQVYSELNSLVGNQGTEYIKSLVQNYSSQDQNLIGTIIGVIVFLVTSTTFFTVLQNSINHVWAVKAKPRHNILKALRDRLLSFGLILSMGFILLVSMLIEAAISFLKGYIDTIFPGVEVVLITVTNVLLTIIILTLIFALIFKFLPDAVIKWRVTWVGALITASLFEGGRALIGLFLGNSNIGLMYGAAGSLVVILLWVFYSSLIFFFGAEITLQYANLYSRDIVPKKYAVKIEVSETREKG